MAKPSTILGKGTYSLPQKGYKKHKIYFLYTDNHTPHKDKVMPH